MHEMSVVSSLLSIVQEEMQKHGVSRLLLVRVRYGALANIVPEALSFAFEALTMETPFEGARAGNGRGSPDAEMFRLRNRFCAASRRTFFRSLPGLRLGRRAYRGNGKRTVRSTY